jgi:WD40 repeat protein
MQLKKKWTFKYDEPILGAKLSSPKKEQTKKLFLSTKSGKILAFDLNGKLLIEEEITENSPIWNIEICDLNNDGIEELILGGMDGLLRMFQISSQTTLEPLWAHQFGSSVSGFRIEDVTNDRCLEIIAYSLDKSLRILSNNDGSLVWGQLFEDGIEDAKIWTDRKNSDKREVLACGNDGTIRIFEAINGNLLWFKRFSDKVRFIDYINSDKGILIICGGDDKQLHFINKESQEEIKTIEFDDYVWKCLSFPSSIKDALLVSSYSFEYLDHSKPIQKINFTSKLLYVDQNLNIKWELQNKNVEAILRFQVAGQSFIAIGTTKGQLLILDEKNGTIRFSINHNSCVNAIQYEPVNKMLIICLEDGLIDCLLITDN